MITRGGETVGILIPPSGAGIEGDIDLLARLRLGRALAAIQRESVLHETDDLSMEEIDVEILVVRKERNKRMAK